MRVRALARRLGRRLLWWLWPTWRWGSRSWRDLVRRGRSPGIEIGRLTFAAVAAFLVANLVSPDGLGITAALTALLVVQVSTVGTVKTSLARIGAVLAGVLIAVGVAAFIGLTWWTLALVVAISLVVGRVLRLGEQTVEVPISAMLILAVSAPGAAAETRVVSTLIGAAVGLAVSLLAPAPIPNTRAYDAVRRVARSQASLLDEVALTLGTRAPDPEQVAAWTGWLDQIESDIEEAEAAVRVAEDARIWNARALAVAKVHLGLRAELERLERCLTAERALLVALGNQVRLTVRAAGTPPVEPAVAAREGELRRVFAIVLDGLADGLRAQADVISARFGSGTGGQLEDALSRSVNILAEVRAEVTDLVLLEVDQRHQPDLWLLQGSVFAAAEQLITELDFVQTVTRTAPWLARNGLPTSLEEIRLPGIEIPFLVHRHERDGDPPPGNRVPTTG